MVARVRASRNVQIVLASGTGSARLSSRKRMPFDRLRMRREPVLDQVLAALVRQRVHALQHQNLGHQHMVERRPAALAAVRAWHCPPQSRLEHLEVDQPLQALKVVALGRQVLQPLVDVEKSCLTPHRHSSHPQADGITSGAKQARFLEVSTLSNPSAALKDYAISQCWLILRNDLHTIVLVVRFAPEAEARVFVIGPHWVIRDEC